MDPDFATKIANSVLDDFDLFDPPGLTRIEQVVHSYMPYEPESKLKQLINMKAELDKLIEEESKKESKKEIKFKNPTPEFTDAVYKLLTKESPIRSSSIPHKLPAGVLPPIGYKGLFTSWMNQLINVKKEYVKDGSQEYYNYSLYYPILEYQNLPQINYLPVVEHQTTKRYKVCWQKKRGKPCNNLDESGNCKFCSE
jgi:hypothetical protein